MKSYVQKLCQVQKSGFHSILPNNLSILSFIAFHKAWMWRRRRFLQMSYLWLITHDGLFSVFWRVMSFCIIHYPWKECISIDIKYLGDSFLSRPFYQNWSSKLPLMAYGSHIHRFTEPDINSFLQNKSYIQRKEPPVSYLHIFPTVPVGTACLKDQCCCMPIHH